MDTKTKTETTKIKKDHSTYGLYLLASQHSGETELTKLSSEIKKILTDNNSNILNEQNFKKIELSYPIKKSLYSYNSQITFRTDPSNIPAIKESLREITETLIRYMITKESEQKEVPYTKKKEMQEKPKKKKEVSIEDIEAELDNIKI